MSIPIKIHRNEKKRMKITLLTDDEIVMTRKLEVITHGNSVIVKSLFLFLKGETCAT